MPSSFLISLFPKVNCRQEDVSRLEINNRDGEERRAKEEATVGGVQGAALSHQDTAVCVVPLGCGPLGLQHPAKQRPGAEGPP